MSASLRPLQIRMDHRERHGPADLLPRLSSVALTVETLPVGDYWIENHLIVERKTIFDFANSLITGRLFHQARRLASQPIPTLLLIEKNGITLGETGVRREAWMGALLTLHLSFGIPTLHTAGPEESVQMLLYAGSQIRRRSLVKVGGYKSKTVERIRLQMLQHLPGIGSKRARRLLQHFGSVEKTLTTPATDWQPHCKRIGTKQLEKIEKILRSNAVIHD